MFSLPHVITLPLAARFKDAFPDTKNHNGLIPDNAIINKGKTGFGITYSEFRANRHSIIAVPQTPIIEDKVDEHSDRNPLAVMQGVTIDSIAQYLECKQVRYKKIAVTPESFWKIVEAAKSIGKEQWLYDEFFCFLDECHCYACDAFREDILTPFRYFWSFRNKALGSATPYPFSDPRFQTLTHYKIRFEEKFGVINIVHDKDPKAVLNYYLTHPELFPGKVFIFYNSVTSIGQAVRSSGIQDVNIYCRDDEKNLENLEEAHVHFQRTTKEGSFKKFNFFSCRYNEGWDLRDDPSATIILITDTSIPHSLVGIDYRGFQAVGRLRLELGEKPHKIIHITNTLENEDMIDRTTIELNVLDNAKSHIKYFNTFLPKNKKKGMKDILDLEDFIKPYSRFENGIAVIDHYKIDQLVYARASRLQYSSIENIENCWQNCNYETERTQFSFPKIQKVRKSQETINKEVIELFEEYKAHPEKYHFSEAQRQTAKLKEDYEILFQAYEMLGLEEIEKLNYNNKEMKAKLIEKSNTNKEAKLRLMVSEQITTGKYTKKEIKSILQGIYDALEIKNPDGSRKVAKASELQDLGMFQIAEVKETTPKGTRINKIHIVASLYTRKVAA